MGGFDSGEVADSALAFFADVEDVLFKHAGAYAALRALPAEVLGSNQVLGLIAGLYGQMAAHQIALSSLSRIARAQNPGLVREFVERGVRR